MEAPDGLADCEAVVRDAKPNATVTLPAAWVRDLIIYARRLETALRVYQGNN
jgi:hypothetical protein